MLIYGIYELGWMEYPLGFKLILELTQNSIIKPKNTNVNFNCKSYGEL